MDEVANRIPLVRNACARTATCFAFRHAEEFRNAFAFAFATDSTGAVTDTPLITSGAVVTEPCLCEIPRVQELPWTVHSCTVKRKLLGNLMVAIASGAGFFVVDRPPTTVQLT